MNYFAMRAQYIGDRTEQQDAVGVSHVNNSRFVQHGGFAAVIADGVGGGHHGKEAAQIAVASFLEEYHRKPESEAITFALERALKAANDAVFSFSQRTGQEGTCCATLVAAVIHGTNAHWISAGDSRAYLLRNGLLHRLTSDHTVARSLKEDVADGFIAAGDAGEHPDGDDLTSYVGKSEPPHSDGNCQPFPLVAGDRIVLCTDGVYRTLEESEIAAVLLSEGRNGCNRIMRLIEDRRIPRQDNSTLLVIGAKPGIRNWLNVPLICLGILLVVDVVLAAVLLYKVSTELVHRSSVINCRCAGETRHGHGHGGGYCGTGYLSVAGLRGGFSTELDGPKRGFSPEPFGRLQVKEDKANASNV